MDPIYIVLICVAVVVIVGIVLFILLRKKKPEVSGKSRTELLQESRNRVAVNQQSVEVLYVLAEGKQDNIAEFQKIQEKLKYLTPSAEESVKEIDEKIHADLEECKSVLEDQTDEAQDEKLKNLIRTINADIALRAPLTNK